MTGKSFRQTLRTWMLPIAMAGGIIFHSHMHLIAPFSPYLIGIMLLITYCKLNPREMSLNRFSLVMLSVQLGGGVLLYVLLLPFNELLAQGAFICVFCPTATAAPVITGMLGGSITRLATFSLASNFSVALLAPILFTWMGADNYHQEIPLLNIAMQISFKVVPIILGPLLIALFLEYVSPRLHREIGSHQGISFYVWAVSLFIVVGNAVSYVIGHLSSNPDEGTMMLELSLVSLFACCSQFYIGRKLGGLQGDKVAGAQGLGQKNTVLAIWMSLTFLNPLTSVAPAAYVAWQNTINSLQLMHRARKIKTQVQ